MHPLNIYSVIPKLPASIQNLWNLAYNLWFEWKHEVAELFSHMDYKLWEKSGKNPIAFLNSLPQSLLEELSQDSFFVERLKELDNQLKQYVNSANKPIKFPVETENEPIIAYFSAEYGLTQCLPLYSGGLGILAGDHLKSASDLNLPLVGIGLAYQQGYFHQYLTLDGWQQENYPVNDFEQMPLAPVLLAENNSPPLP
mgnify:FL=1